MNQYIDCDSDDLMLWFGWAVLAIVLAWTLSDPCADLTPGTDAYFECLTGEPTDLTPSGRKLGHD